MTELRYGFEYFSTRSGFNDAATHFDTMGAILKNFSGQINLADSLNRLLNSKELRQEQIPPIITALLKEKFGYHYVSINMPENCEPTDKMAKEFSSWGGVDIVVVYNHPDLGCTVINPKNPQHWSSVSLLKKNELLTVYVGAFGDSLKNPNLAIKGASTFLTVIQGKRRKVAEELKKGSYKFIDVEEPKKPKTARPRRRTSASARQSSQTQEPQRTQLPQAVASRMTPRYSIPVTNELFHNGNVEAWKKIIQSYQTKNLGLNVYIYYDGERIHDIHTLFKWGKVKHGSTILFAVAGEDIKDVAKLQRYLRQGASPRFEDFLKFPVNKILNLF